MLDLTGRPTPASLLDSTTSPITAPTLAELHAHVAERTDISVSTRSRYLNAIEDVGERLNKPLALIPAELALVEDRFPMDGFDPGHWSSNDAYELFRRRVQAPLREFLGFHAEQARLRALEDDWTQLFAAVKPLTEDKVGCAQWHPMRFAALKSFALVARAYGWQPRDLGLAEAQRLDADFRGNKRDANRRALMRLDELRRFPQLLQWLPARPIGFTAEARVPLLMPLPCHWEEQFREWTNWVTKSGWDPVDQAFADDHDDHAHVILSAFRTSLRIAVEIGVSSLEQMDLRALFSDDEAICAIAAEMFARRERSKADGRLKPRTSRKYLMVLNQVRGHLGIDTTLLDQVLANNAVAREGKKADKRMTAKNRAFCENLVENSAMRRRFFESFRALRDEAETLLSRAALEKRELTGHERSRARFLGASACFAAIEIGGAPIRASNAMGLTCIGEDAEIRVSTSGKKPFKVLIPGERTKNGFPIEFSIRHNSYGYFDAIRWYFLTIRPLFPHAATSPYLFPAVTAAGMPLNADYFGAEFSGLMRTVANFPMTPHQMRHGQTSLLLDRYPNEIEVIATRIGDTATTLRQYYGWLNSLKLVERGQDLLVGLMDE